MHDYDDDALHTHDHGHTADHEHSHGHTHPHTQTAAVLNRLSRAIGHLESIRRMVETGRDCTEVLVQLAAVRAALSGVSRVILKDHVEHCITDAVERHDQQAITDLNNAIDHLLK